MPREKQLAIFYRWQFLDSIKATAAEFGLHTQTVSTVIDSFLIVRVKPQKPIKPKMFTTEYYKFWISVELDRSLSKFEEKYISTTTLKSKL